MKLNGTLPASIDLALWFCKMVGRNSNVLKKGKASLPLGNRIGQNLAMGH
jgi:hypothetical protein